MNPTSTSTTSTWPTALFDLAFFPSLNDKLDDLANLAEPEDWNYQHTTTTHHKPILYNYLQYTYKRLADEDKLEKSDDAKSLTFNTGLVTPSASQSCKTHDENLPLR